MSFMSTHTFVEGFFARLYDRWRARNELAGIERSELDRIAGDLGIRVADLGNLVEHGADAAQLLYERMRVLGMSRADIEHSANGVMRDLERTCALCHDKGVCENDLNRQPDDPSWKAYCPNAVTLDDVLTWLNAHRPAASKENQRDYYVRTAREAREQAEGSEDRWGKISLKYVAKCSEVLAREKSQSDDESKPMPLAQ
jgi:hypothetical protein